MAATYDVERASEQRRTGLAYASAVIGTALVLVIRMELDRVLEVRAPFLMFVVPITVAAVLGGLRPGIAATALGSVAGWYAILVPRNAFAIAGAGEGLNLALFVMVGVCVSAVCERMHRAITQAERELLTRKANAELTRRVEARTAELHDIEEQAARRLGKLEAILWSVNEGLIIADGTGNLIEMNPAGLALYGYKSIDEARSSLDAWDVRDERGDPLPKDQRPLARVLRGERIAEVVVRLRHKETGRALVVACSGAPVTLPTTQAPPSNGSDGSIVRAILVARDVTRQKGAEEALRASEESAQRSLAQLEAVLSERETILESERWARAEAERANQMKDEFLAVLSHELRTPLNAILGWSSMLRRPIRTAAQIDKGLEVIERNARHQVQLISDLLDVSRIVAGKLRIDLAPADVAVSVEAALDAMRGAAAAKSIELVSSITRPDAPVLGDPARLQQIATNLISNAIKFTPSGGRVEVSVSESAGRVEITVRDTGRGIAGDFVPRVFDRFRQADASTTREHGGLGLGLAIVRHLVELHGGSARAESAGLGRGATFTISLPCMTNDRADPSISVTTETSSLSGVRVLVVDDEEDARDLVRQLLESHEARVEVASSGEHALAMLEGGALDVIVSDIGMPRMDGYALIRRVRGIEAHREVPAIALTAFARDEDRDLALAAGYQAHVTKPIEPRELIAAVRRLTAAPRPRGRPEEQVSI